MKVCGYNASFCLGEKSNNKDPFGNLFISPPVDSHIDVHNLLSFSIFSEHSVFIDKQNQCFAYKHCVFALGSNENGELGIGKSDSSSQKFKPITSLQKYKIVSASAGFSHSLFLTSEGTVLACGKNDFGQLLLRSGRSDNCQFLPVETTVVSGASYCIAGNCISVVFTCDQLPQNMPNRPIENPFIKMKMQLDEALESARKLREENRKLIQQNEMFKNECIRLQQEIAVVREENAKLKRTSHNDQNGTLKIERPKSSSVVIINKSNRQESNE